MSTAVALDPVIHFSLRMTLALLFLSAALHKLRDVRAFRQALTNYRLLPESLSVAAAISLIVAELGVASTLPFLKTSGPALGAALLLAIYTGAIGLNLLRGRRDIDCGCAGPARRQPLSGGLIARNAALALVSLAAALPSSSRPLMWMDGVTITATVAFFSLLYSAVGGLMRNSQTYASFGRAGWAQAFPPALGSFGGRASPQAPAAALGGAA